MAFVFSFADGFDHYDPAGDVPTWATKVGEVTTTTGPHHGQAAVFTGGGNFLEGAAGGSFTSAGCAFNLRIHGSTWGLTDAVAVAQFRLYDVTKGTLVVYADGRVAALEGDEHGGELASSPAGAFPMNTWVHVGYSTSLWENGADEVGPGGRVDVSLDGEVVATASGVPTTEAPHRTSHLRLGNIAPGGNAVRLDVDDLAYLYTFETDYPEPVPPTGAHLPHGVLTLYPVGPGDRTELGVGAGSGENWEVCAEPVGDGDASYVVKSGVGTAADLYRIADWPAELPVPPTDSEDDPTYDDWGAYGWGMLKDAGGAFGQGSFLVAYTDWDGSDNQFSHRAPLELDAWTYVGNRVSQAQAALASMQLGFGMAPGDFIDAEQDEFLASQAALCVWYPGPYTPPPPVGGGTRWRVQWVD